jgi:nicotinamide riboside kinase
MANLFPIAGGQLTGKTTLCHKVVSQLKMLGINAGYSQEAVRTSYLMFKGDRGEKMHLESLLIQIGNEIIASEHYDVVICDRSAIDYLAYARLRFPYSNNVYIESVEALVLKYSEIYAKVFITNKTIGWDAGDPLRVGENTESESVSQTIADIAKKIGVPWEWIEAATQDTPSHSVTERVLLQLKGLS